jgi:hypothetical protein
VARPRKLTDSEKAANVAAGLTPNGFVPGTAKDIKARAKKPLASKKIDAASAAPVGRTDPTGGGGDFPVGDYRHRGTKFGPVRKNHWLRVVRESGEEALASAEVGVSRSTIRDHLASDPLFREARDEAFRQHASLYAKEMKRRGLDGYQEPVFGSQGPGSGVGIVGWVTRYSDRLLLEQARRFNKEYTPIQKVEQTTTLKGSPTLGLDRLAPESREDLRRILEREAVNGGLEPEPEGEEPEEG